MANVWQNYVSLPPYFTFFGKLVGKFSIQYLTTFWPIGISMVNVFFHPVVCKSCGEGTGKCLSLRFRKLQPTIAPLRGVASYRFYVVCFLSLSSFVGILGQCWSLMLKWRLCWASPHIGDAASNDVRSDKDWNVLTNGWWDLFYYGGW